MRSFWRASDRREITSIADPQAAGPKGQGRRRRLGVFVKRLLVPLLVLVGGVLFTNALLTVFSRENRERLTQESVPADDPDLQLVQSKPPHDQPRQTPGSFTAQALPFLERNCLACHGLVEPKGGISLVFGDEAAAKSSPLWNKVIQVIDSGQMPPASRPRPQEAQARAFRAWAQMTLNGAGPGGVPVRRLNRAEYNNTVRDLLGATLRPADDFPPDDSGEGFDNLAQVLSISPTHVETYLRSADALIESARGNRDQWQKLAMPPVADFIPYVLRGSPPERNDPVKALRLEAEDEAAQARAKEIDRAYYALQAFADRAYRRPVSHHEMYRLMLLVDESLSANEGVDAGLARAFKAILISPHFLFRMEMGGPTTDPKRSLTEFELASRLSYFLWSTMPDEELSRLAARGELSRPSILNAQVRRMLLDTKASALAENFAGQWLQIRALAEVTRDPGRFPEFDDELRRDMLEETNRFFEHIVGTDQSVLDFLLADYTFVNARLASHYGLGGVTGNEFRRVSLASGDRAGLLTHASILTVTASATRTSPVKRGRWILDNVLGSPPMSPPPGADTLAKAANDTLTSRQRFDLHRARAECAVCHGRMDPLGYALEHYGSTGAWRDRDDDGPIEATGTLPDGLTIQGAHGLRRMLAQRPEEFVRCLTQKLLIYALGRPLTPADRPAVDAIVEHASHREYHFSSLIIALVRSTPFQEMRSQDATIP